MKQYKIDINQIACYSILKKRACVNYNNHQKLLSNIVNNYQGEYACAL